MGGSAGQRALIDFCRAMLLLLEHVLHVLLLLLNHFSKVQLAVRMYP
jgi:hypothetical protein